MEAKKLFKVFTYGDLYRYLNDMIECSGKGLKARDLVSGCDEDGEAWEPVTYYIIPESDAEFLIRMTRLPVYYSPETEIYYLGQTFYGVSPDYEPASDILTDEGVRYFNFKGWNTALVSDGGDSFEIEGRPGVVYRRRTNDEES